MSTGNQSADLAALHSQLQAFIDAQAAASADAAAAVNAGWTILCGALVFLMQLGFLLLEAGSVKAVNTKNIFFQNEINVCISVLCWYLFGFGLSQGYYSPGIGDMLDSATNSGPLLAKFFFFWAFNNAATTIVSGAITSRVKFAAYVCSCIMISGFVYPMVCYWVWGNGMFGPGRVNADGTRTQQYPMLDFAGGTVVHQVGGVSGLVMAWVLGPRTGRFVQNTEGKWEDKKEPGHSIVLATIGTFLLWFGWFGFNAGSTLALYGSHLVAALAAVNTLIAAAVGGLVITVHFVYFHKVHDSFELLNGFLAGLVAITPCCAFIDTWWSIFVGATSVYVYLGFSRLVAKFRIDDVVDTGAIHGACGFWGTLCSGLLASQTKIDAVFGPGVIQYSVGKQFGIQLLANVTICVFTAVCAAALFLALKYTIGIRVSESDERIGLDFKYHAGYAYADFNQRVKKAHEQMQLEAEIANQVRKELAQGRGKRFKEVMNIPLKPQPLQRRPSNNSQHTITGGSNITNTGSRVTRNVTLHGEEIHRNGDVHLTVIGSSAQLPGTVNGDGEFDRIQPRSQSPVDRQKGERDILYSAEADSSVNRNHLGLQNGLRSNGSHLFPGSDGDDGPMTSSHPASSRAVDGPSFLASPRSRSASSSDS